MVKSVAASGAVSELAPVGVLDGELPYFGWVRYSTKQLEAQSRNWME
jgi:hypothetical protein